MATPEETLTTLVQELSASGNTPINPSTTDLAQPDFTLRQAVSRILWKEAAAVNLKGGRPEDPSVADDQLGHVLSLRAEVLILSSIVTDLAARLGTDVVTIRNQVIESLKS
jgi:hypothetical protein